MLPLVEKIHPTQTNKIPCMNLEGENNYNIINMIGESELLDEMMDKMDALGSWTQAACGYSFYRFPQEEEQLQHWISSMQTAAGWRPSESALLCSDHFTPDCFQTSGRLHSYAVPSVFQSTEETSATSLETSEHEICGGCEKQVHLIEKSYKLKLLSAQLKVKKYEKELSERSHRVTKLQRKVIVLQTALKVMSMRKLVSSPKRQESSSNTTSLMK
ncbi:THAP domain-containing protein 2 [Tachysurus vachellii]|uniref:THAP domain-containing protein 2 n=1 Tax=Tachysurus vachellii TaxID=175792 RepID=UPI00296B2D33|nr:THAP domain-containing protein 2 [Tachysurus vachellii]